MCGGVAKPLVEGIREAGFDRSLTWQGTADGFRSARWESLRALPLGGKGRSLSGRCEIVMLSDFMLLFILIELPFIDNCSNREVYVHFLLNL